ncbi:hypothetical protein H8K35_10225 [Undibacterium sp. LX40W]|uniref:Uncharacterized protein n=1 Tax=Undibacterium nitidum TaxID=2762298 RepID=A0A923KLL2_9BURK|nr:MULTISPECIES: hypothetical protein [Undibacterium]MBC3881970.1 hypothetical protein [Undibacterium nitidum]MBC3892034.1 hypothetical protein [Undibacterium sp. LX40W]
MRSIDQHREQFVQTTISGRVLVTRVSGSWTPEMHRAADEYNQDFVTRLNETGNWASLVIIEDTLVSCLEVLQAGRESIPNNPNCTRLKALAWIIDESIEGYTILLPRYRSLFDGVLRSEVFNDIESGLNWLDLCLSQGS